MNSSVFFFRRQRDETLSVSLCGGEATLTPHTESMICLGRYWNLTVKIWVWKWGYQYHTWHHNGKFT